MILLWILIILISAALLSWLGGRWNSIFPRVISLVALSVALILAFSVWFNHTGETSILSKGERMLAFNHSWMPQFGIGFHLSMDGLSFLMVILSLFIGMLSIIASWKQETNSGGFFYFNVMLLLAGIIGVFLSADLFLFFFFWELMLVPMYFIIALWGDKRGGYAATKFFIFTQGSGLLMLISILGIYFLHGQSTGSYTFDYYELLGTATGTSLSKWLMLGFFFAFIVKLPLVPFHTWLPDATTEAPTTGSIILAGLLWNTGAYGILRFVVPLFPEASRAFAPVAMVLGIVGIIYAAKLAFAQVDLKKLIVFTSISHMGFLMVGIFSFHPVAMQGVIIQLFTHAISTSALLILAGKIQEQMNTKDVEQMGGLWTSAPVMGGVGLIFVMDTLALPGLGNFVAEFLILLGAFQVNVTFAVLASLGIIASCIYSLRIMQKVFYGPQSKSSFLGDLNPRELIVMAALVIPSVFFGLYPQPLFRVTNPSIKNILQETDAKVEQTFLNRNGQKNQDPSFLELSNPTTPKGGDH
jgi:NADH-quinone oxidoreductase subunit M